MIVHNPNDLPTIPLADILPTQGNLKDLSKINYQKLKNIIERRGFSYPVYVWEDDNKLLHLLDGHQRQRVLNTEGWNDPIPYLKVPAKDLQEAMARLLEITSQYATITQEGIDEFIATYELNEAEVYESTSFDALRFGDTEEAEVEEDEAPEISSEPAISKLGEIYQLGRHRVMCGDSTDAGNVALLMNGVKADMVFTDPPYNQDRSGGKSDYIGKAVNKLTDSISEMIDFEPKLFLEILNTMFSGNINAYIFCNKTLIPDYINWALDNKYSFNVLFWKKPNAIPLADSHRSDVEYIIFIRKNAIWNNSLNNVNYSKCL